MYLILGNDLDPWCRRVSTALGARGLSTRILDSPFAGRTRLSWTLADISKTSLVLDDGYQVTSEQLDGVLVCSRGWIQSNGWQAEDHDYMRSETQAALLGWLWSLSCPVVGRLPASVWYRPLTPITFWQPLLVRFGLAAPEALVTNQAGESRAFRDRLGGRAIYAPFSTPAHYLVATEDDWKGLEAVQDRAPVCLAQPHGAGQLVCLVGNRVIWDGGAPAGAAQLEAGLGRFAASAGLNFVQFAIAGSDDSPQVLEVTPAPRLERFGDPARQDIVDAVVELLTWGASRDASKNAAVRLSA